MKEPSHSPHITALNETPVKKKISGSVPYTSMHYQRQKWMKDLGDEMTGKFAGPISPKQFLDFFLPGRECGRHGQVPSINKILFHEITTQSREEDMYIPMISALTPFCPGFTLVDTHAHPDKGAAKNGLLVKPDVCLYDTRCRRDTSVPTDMSYVEICIEFKLNPSDDAFSDEMKEFERRTQQSTDTKGQITAYTATQLSRQFRTHAFSVIICKDRARLIYWDRSGAVVTNLFSYVEESWLGEFFWRYAHSSPALRGLDESVTPVPIDTNEAQVTKAREALKLSKDIPLFKFVVSDEQKDFSIHCFGSSRARFLGNDSPTGRATRAYDVYCPPLNRIVLMKDTWRVALPGIQTEGSIYAELHKNHVSHIPQCLQGGDVSSQFCDTRSNTFAEEFGLSLRPHTHYRILLDDIGRDLTSFENTKELVSTITDALQACTDAYVKAGILHRDISVGNIIISDRGGLLIDWDLSKHKSDRLSRQPYRTGTWQFMAARLLQAKGPVEHTHADDLESFFHVLSWMVLRFTKHDLTTGELTNLLETAFEGCYYDEGQVFGGQNKAQSTASKQMSVIGVPPGPLYDLIKDLVDVFAVRYEPPPTDIEKKEHKLYLQGNTQESYVHSFSAVERYNNRLAKLKDGWVLEKFKTASNSQTWNLGLDTKRVENPIYRRGGPMVTSKRSSAFQDDESQQQRKRSKP